MWTSTMFTPCDGEKPPAAIQTSEPFLRISRSETNSQGRPLDRPNTYGWIALRVSRSVLWIFTRCGAEVGVYFTVATTAPTMSQADVMLVLPNWKVFDWSSALPTSVWFESTS